jgi:hypothetical protein
VYTNKDEVSRASLLPRFSSTPQSHLLQSPHNLWRGTTACRESLCTHYALHFNSSRQLCSRSEAPMYRWQALAVLYARRKQACRPLATSDEDGKTARMAVVCRLEGRYIHITMRLSSCAFLQDLGQSHAVLGVRVVEQLKQYAQNPLFTPRRYVPGFLPADIRSGWHERDTLDRRLILR